MHGVTIKICLTHSQIFTVMTRMRAILIAYFCRVLVPISALPQKKWKDYLERSDNEIVFNKVRILGIIDAS